MTHMFAIIALGTATRVAQGGPNVNSRTRWTVGPPSFASPLDLDHVESYVGALALVVTAAHVHVQQRKTQCHATPAASAQRTDGGR